MRKRDSNFPDNGFEAWGGYMQAKITKLEEQYSSKTSRNTVKLSTIFQGISIYVNGYTKPSAEELKSLMSLHGGVYHTYERPDDYIIASNLPDTKVKKKTLSRVIKPNWITDSIEANKLLDYKNYLLYNSSRTQPKLMFDSTITESVFTKCKTNVKTNNAQCDPKDEHSKIPLSENESIEQQVVNKISKTMSSVNPNFISEFYNNSRLHHISQLGATFKQLVNDMRDKSNFKFPLREKWINTKLQNTNHKSHMMFDNSKIIMHIDMDCFFVSVGLRNRPELRGKPVAVTHSKGGQPHSKRPGVDRSVEFNLYKQKQIKKLSNTTGLDIADLHSNLETRVDNITDEDDKFGSMSEIASCSYEARAKGITNGMFMGNALRLCPDLQTIPYDFDGYKEVASILYDTVAQYTLDIEAVSCDEMYVDCTDLLTSTDLSVEFFATALRDEIKDKTGCPCSTGFGSNRLQARLATKQAKPNGQFFLTSNLVKDYMCEIKLKDLPGVGRQIAQKLESLGHTTCGSLQSLPLNVLQQHLGNKTGALLFEQCRGIDSHPLSYYNVRKSVSAEVNYGIRFENNDQCFDFVRQLASEVNSRMLQFRVVGRCITLKLMIRAEEAPVETAKFMGHGFCNVLNKSSTLIRSTNDADTIFKEVILIIKKLNVDPKELRGIGIQVTKLESSNPKDIKGAISRFLSAKPKLEPQTSHTSNHSGILHKQNMNSPKNINSPEKQKSPNLKNKSPLQRKRGRPPKSPRIPAASKNLLSKFIQGQTYDSYFNEEITTPQDDKSTSVTKVSTAFKEKPVEKRSSDFLDLEWVQVRELLRAWLESGRAPLACDVRLLAAYMRHMVLAKSIHDLRVLLHFLLRRTSEMSSERWNEVCDGLVKQVQNAMLAVYGKKLLL